MMTSRIVALTLALLLLLMATSVQAQTYLPLVLGNDTAQSAEISYGFYQTLDPNQWIDIECVTGEPVATFDNGRLHAVCE
jgi:hypothetical protein